MISGLQTSASSLAEAVYMWEEFWGGTYVGSWDEEVPAGTGCGGSVTGLGTRAIYFKSVALSILCQLHASSCS